MRVISRTMTTTTVHVRVFNSESGLAEAKVITFPNTFKDTNALKRACKKEFANTVYTFIDVQETKEDSAVYAMSEAEFIATATKYNSRQEINKKN